MTPAAPESPGLERLAQILARELFGATAVAFAWLALTGVLLGVYFRPGSDSKASIDLLTHSIAFGWAIRSVHAWLTHLVIALWLFWLVAAYVGRLPLRTPWAWWTGLAVLAAMILAGISGYQLIGDARAEVSARVALGLLAAMPLLGPTLTDLATGGAVTSLAPGSEYPVRVWLLHVQVVPFVLAGVWIAMGSRSWAQPRPSLWSALLVVPGILPLALLLPPITPSASDLNMAPHADWYAQALSRLLGWLSAPAALTIVGLVGLWLMSLPWLLARPGLRRACDVTTGLLALAWLALTYL